MTFCLMHSIRPFFVQFPNMNVVCLRRVFSKGNLQPFHYEYPHTNIIKKSSKLSCKKFFSKNLKRIKIKVSFRRVQNLYNKKKKCKFSQTLFEIPFTKLIYQKAIKLSNNIKDIYLHNLAKGVHYEYTTIYHIH